MSRDLRVADFVRDELSRIIQMKVRDPRVGMVSVNDVTVSRDLSYAEVYVSSLDAVEEEQREQLVAVLNKAAGFFRTELAKLHTMRTTPKPRFHYDKVVERGPRMEQLIEDALRADAAQNPEGAAPVTDAETPADDQAGEVRDNG